MGSATGVSDALLTCFVFFFFFSQLTPKATSAPAPETTRTPPDNQWVSPETPPVLLNTAGVCLKLWPGGVFAEALEGIDLGETTHKKPGNTVPESIHSFSE